MRITAAELANRKKRIIYTAYKLFSEEGIDAVLMDSIAKESSVSLNSVFRYFDSKATLVQMTQQYLWEELVQQLLSDSHQRMLLAKNGLEEVEVLLSNFNGLYERHSNYLLFACEYKLFLARRGVSLAGQDYRETLAPVYAAFTAALERGREDGSIVSRGTVESQFFYIWGVMRSYVGEMALFDRLYSGDNLWQDQFQGVLGGLLESLKAEPC